MIDRTRSCPEQPEGVTTQNIQPGVIGDWSPLYLLQQPPVRYEWEIAAEQYPVGAEYVDGGRKNPLSVEERLGRCIVVDVLQRLGDLGHQRVKG